MKASSVVKIAIFLLFLVGAHVLFGVACTKVQSQYGALFTPAVRGFTQGKPLLDLALWVFGSILFLALTGGLVVALVRPLWIISLGFFFSSLAMLLTWGINYISALASLIYFLIAIGFSNMVVDEIKVRLNFSVKPIQQEQKFLLLGLALMIAVSFALGYLEDARQSEAMIPPAYKQMVSDMVTPAMQAQIEKQTAIGLTEKAMALQQLQQGLEKFWVETERTIQPYAPYLPLAIGVLVFWLLETFLGLVSWIPPLLLSGFFPLLKAIGLTHEVAETKEVRRLALD
ncbi:MAG: hypothetical protein KJ606_02810 [Chloroflexi bacterium]|nr:hypothetical protein [Chloroflexota bacterium]